MYRCPSCVTVVPDITVRRCVVCGENFKRHPPKVLGAEQKLRKNPTSWDIKAQADASRVFAQDDRYEKRIIDLPQEHLHDSSGRTAAAERG